MRPRYNHSLLSLLLALTLCACSGRSAEKEAEPLEPQPYGEEESNVELWLETMELSDRELYAARDDVVAALGLGAGDRIADVGSGTGLYSLLFSEAVGANGVVYAVDIEPLFLKLVGQRAADQDAENVVTVLSREDDITLPQASVDVVFIADSYHYFDDPGASLQSIKDALSADGKLIIVDYYSHASDQSDPARDHLRFGKRGLIDEVEAFGFRVIDEPIVDGLKDFYIVVFEPA